MVDYFDFVVLWVRVKWFGVFWFQLCCTRINSFHKFVCIFDVVGANISTTHSPPLRIVVSKSTCIIERESGKKQVNQRAYGFIED